MKTSTSTEAERRNIFEQEIARFYGTRTGNAGEGPTIVSIWVRQSDRVVDGERRPFDPTFDVELDGRHEWGGFADHLPEDLSTLGGSFIVHAEIPFDFEPFEIDTRPAWNFVDSVRRFAPATDELEDAVELPEFDEPVLVETLFDYDDRVAVKWHAGDAFGIGTVVGFERAVGNVLVRMDGGSIPVSVPHRFVEVLIVAPVVIDENGLAVPRREVRDSAGSLS